MQHDLTSTKFSKYLSEHELGHVLDFITALQLMPENHGKSARIELMAKEVLKNLSNGKVGNLKELKEIIAEEFASHYMDDPPEELFTENAVFLGGNYTVMPGINSNSADIFNYLSSSIYDENNGIPRKFKDYIYEGVSLLLNIGSKIFGKAKLRPNLFVDNNEAKLIAPEKIQKLSLSDNELAEICYRKNISINKIDDFVCKPELLEEYSINPYLSPLVYRPFIKYKKRYYLVLPTCQMSAINEYILKATQKFNVQNQIHDLCHQDIWNSVIDACDKIDWFLMKDILPETKPNQSFKEKLLVIDERILAYVCYCYPPELKSIENMQIEANKDLFNSNSNDINCKAISERINVVLEHLRTLDDLKGFKLLTVILTNSMGGDALLYFGEEHESEKRIHFNVFDFINLVHAGEWNFLGLWKYAKVYEFAMQKTPIHSTSAIDTYAMYKNNGDTFYNTDESRPDLIKILPGYGSNLIRQAKIELDEQSVKYRMDNSIVLKKVRKLNEDIPIYKSIYYQKNYESVLKSYDFPIWIKNHQVKSQNDKVSVERMANCIFYWLDKLSTALNKMLSEGDLEILNIILEFDDTYFSNPQTIQQIGQIDLTELKFSFKYEYGNLKLFLPKYIKRLFMGADNEGERILIKEVLKAFNSLPNVELSDDKIKKLLNQFVPLGPTKMIMLISEPDLRCDSTNLVRTIYLSDAENNLVLDKLLNIITPEFSIPDKFQTVNDKKQFCNLIVTNLLKHILKMLTVFENESLLVKLIAINERLIYNTAQTEILTPSQFHCFGIDEKRIKKIEKEQRDTSRTSIATRCLIELLIQNPATGIQKPNFDEIDELIALMNQIFNFGSLSDALHYGLDNPEMDILPSGRIGTSKEFRDQKLKHFDKDSLIHTIEEQRESFPFRLEINKDEGDTNTIKNDEFLHKVDDAFLKDWGVSYSTLYTIYHEAAVIASNKGTIASMLEVDLIDKLKERVKGYEAQVESGLKRLCFEPSQSPVIDKQKGYINSDYFPWHYNREFSYIRRPFLVVETNLGRKYYWGMRQCITSSEYLINLVSFGILKNGGKQIKKILGKIADLKGKSFRNYAANWIKSNTSLKVWDFEVTIEPKGHLKAEENKGDSDIFAYDAEMNQVYNIECKRTVPSKTMHQMKTEIDKYLGRREGERKYIVKHLERDIWLKNNIDQVKEFIGVPKAPNIKSIVLTSKLLPLRYVKEITLPIISFQELKRYGIKILREC